MKMPDAGLAWMGGPWEGERWGEGICRDRVGFVENNKGAGCFIMSMSNYVRNGLYVVVRLCNRSSM